MAMYIPNMKPEQFYDICKKHELEIIAVPAPEHGDLIDRREVIIGERVMICECYRAEKNFLGKVGTCWGTAERDACSCGGDKSKCDFYPSVREDVKKPLTNYDRIISKTPEELAEWIRDQIIDRNIGIPSETWLDWLKQEASE